MKHICARCGLETEPADGKDDHLTTHGICDDCQQVIPADFEEYQRAKKETACGLYK